jgi:nucleolar protein 14
LQPSDRLKSEEELAREEKERLEKLEMERLQRMHGFKEDFVPERKHRSADDLDDGFVYNILTSVLVRTVIFSLSVGT